MADKSRHNSTAMGGETEGHSHSAMKHKTHEEWVIRKEHEDKLKRQLIVESKKDILDHIIQTYKD